MNCSYSRWASRFEENQLVAGGCASILLTIQKSVTITHKPTLPTNILWLASLRAQGEELDAKDWLMNGLTTGWDSTSTWYENKQERDINEGNWSFVLPTLHKRIARHGGSSARDNQYCWLQRIVKRLDGLCAWITPMAEKSSAHYYLL